ncbi:MAG: hypothetical protein ACOC4G_12625, partial [Bacillota bacterium]
MRKIKFALIGFLLVFVTVLIISGVSIAFDPVEDLGPVDFEGATVTYVSAYDPLLEFESGERYAGRLEEAKEKFNIGEIEYVNIPWGETKDTVMSRLMSGDSKYDIWILPTGGAQYYDVAAEGALYPVDQVLPEEYYQSMPQGLQIVYDRLAVDGNKYDFGLDHYTMINYIAWNKELFERESLTPLDELYKEGEWNWETMEEIAVKATRDTSGNDEIDQWGLGQEEIFCWIISNHGSIIEHDEYGDFKFVMHEDEASIYAIDKYEEWESELQIIGDDYTREAWRDGQIAMSPIQF